MVSDGREGGKKEQLGYHARSESHERGEGKDLFRRSDLLVVLLKIC